MGKSVGWVGWGILQYSNGSLRAYECSIGKGEGGDWKEKDSILTARWHDSCCGGCAGNLTTPLLSAPHVCPFMSLMRALSQKRKRERSAEAEGLPGKDKDKQAFSEKNCPRPPTHPPT